MNTKALVADMILNAYDRIMAIHDTGCARFNKLAVLRQLKGLSQSGLAAKSGVSRSEISAIETRRLVPSVETALLLADALDVSVEEIFPASTKRELPQEIFDEGTRLFECHGPRGSRYLPFEMTQVGVVPHDAVQRGGRIRLRNKHSKQPTLVLAGCDPAVGILERYLAGSGVRLIPLQRGSEAALDDLDRGLADLAGIHFSSTARVGRGESTANLDVVRERLGTGHVLMRLAIWNQGWARISKRSRLPKKPRWAAREPGSAARQLLDSLLDAEGHHPRLRKVVRDHLTVAQLVKEGWADAGVCVEYAASLASVDFVPLQSEAYDLCIPEEILDHAAVSALVRTVRSREFRTAMGDLPGYDTTMTGEIRNVA